MSFYIFYDKLLKNILPLIPNGKIPLGRFSEALVSSNFDFFYKFSKLTKPYVKSTEQTGGSIYEYNGYKFNISFDEEDDRVTYAIYNKNNFPCMVIFIPKYEHYAYIETLSSVDGCVLSGNPKTKLGTLLLHMTLNFIENQLKNKYELKYIQLKDNSLFRCEKTQTTIEFDSFYMLTHGNTWYGKYGFIPYDVEKQRTDKVTLKYYKLNQKLVDKKISQIELENILQKANKKINFSSNEKIKSFVDKYKDNTIQKFMYDMAKKYDKTCDIISLIYKEIMRQIGMISLHGKSYYLKL